MAVSFSGLRSSVVSRENASVRQEGESMFNVMIEKKRKEFSAKIEQGAAALTFNGMFNIRAYATDHKLRISV